MKKFFGLFRHEPAVMVEQDVVLDLERDVEQRVRTLEWGLTLARQDLENQRVLLLDRVAGVEAAAAAARKELTERDEAWRMRHRDVVAGLQARVLELERELERERRAKSQLGWELDALKRKHTVEPVAGVHPNVVAANKDREELRSWVAEHGLDRKAAKAFFEPKFGVQKFNRLWRGLNETRKTSARLLGQDPAGPETDSQHPCRGQEAGGSEGRVA